MALTICVYCASSEAIDPGYRAVAARLGRAIASEGWRLVYGGGNVGLMGELARSALDAGGHVTGIIPHRLATREIALEGVTELIRVETMRERKALMDERADAFVVLPGGIGTLEELVEIVTLKQLGYHDRAVIVLDAAGYWDPLREQLRRMVDERFAQPTLLDLFTFAADVETAVATLRSYRPPRPRAAPPAGGEELEELEAVEAPPRDQ